MLGLYVGIVDGLELLLGFMEGNGLIDGCLVGVRLRLGIMEGTGIVLGEDVGLELGEYEGIVLGSTDGDFNVTKSTGHLLHVRGQLDMNFALSQ